MAELHIWKQACAALLLAVAISVAAPAQSFKLLATFDGTDGAYPAFMYPAQGRDGGIYATATEGGASDLCQGGCGTIFKITRGGQLTEIYSFCSQSNCADGVLPIGGLLLTTSGTFYGTNINGGANGSGGTIFKVTADGSLTTLYSFCGQPNCTDGYGPSGLVQATDGNFYGTTYYGGAYSHGGASGYGTIFKVTPQGVLTTLYNFCSQTNCADGENPSAGLIQGTDGNLYGVAGGGTNCYPYGCGTIFRITIAGKLTTLHSFDGDDGDGPSGALIQSPDGNLYGTTGLGGASGNCGANHGCGTVFKITLDGRLTTLYNFCGQPNCTDGAGPTGTLVLATDGNFYGVTYGGGAVDCGTVFKIVPGDKATIVHSFCEQTGCTDGSEPMGALLQATDGNFYGTTEYGGAPPPCDSCGTVFKLSMGLAPFVAFVRDFGKIGSTMQILGQGFKGTTAVSLAGIPAKFTIKSGTYLTATVPYGATDGFVTVTTLKGKLKSNHKFRVIR